MSDTEPGVETEIAERYTLLRLLGEGGMGEVYEALQRATERKVALKLIRAKAADDPQLAARFQRELKIAAKLEHPNTVRIYDFGELDGRLFLAMELLRGCTLAETIRNEGALGLERSARIGLQIAHALRAAHTEGIVHRDLKPDNIMLISQYGEQDVVKVVDFGIATLLEPGEQPSLTKSGVIIGTPAYMSSEQALGLPVDARTDLYSLGVILFEMASGRRPFAAPTPNALIVAHATEVPPPLKRLVPDVDSRLAALVAQLLDKDPAARPQTAHEVETRLHELAHPRLAREAFTQTAQAPPANTSGRGVKLAWLRAAAVLSVGVVAIAALVMYLRAPEETSQAQQPTAAGSSARLPALQWACAQTDDGCTCVAGQGISVNLCSTPMPACCYRARLMGADSCECWPETSEACRTYSEQHPNAAKVSVCPPP